MVHGVKVIRPEKIAKTIADENVKEVLLAAPSASRGERRLALKALEPFPVVVKTLPALEEIAAGEVQVSDLRPIDVDDLLGRDPVTPDLELLAANVRGKVVMITGAGGSIGSELTRQLLKLGPKALVLFELSEVALYDISMEIEDVQRRIQKEDEGATVSATGVVANAFGYCPEGTFDQYCKRSYATGVNWHGRACLYYYGSLRCLLY